MPALRFNYLNLIAFSLATALLCGLQTTFWFQIFGSLPAPLLWLNLVLYIILYRKPIEGVLTIYWLALFIQPFTATPLGLLWANMLVLFAIVAYTKKRLFWPTLKYFVIASLGITFLYELSFFGISRWFETKSLHFSFFNFFFEMTLTAVTAGPVYFVLSWLDRMTRKEVLPESGITEI